MDQDTPIFQLTKSTSKAHLDLMSTLSANFTSGDAALLPDSSAELSLAQVAESYSQSVPFQIRVAQSSMVDVPRHGRDPLVVATGEVYSVHLVRKMGIVTAQHCGKELKIPINTSAKFGLVTEEEVTLYDTVEEILNAKTLPKMVAVRRRSTSSDDVLRRNDVLYLKEAVKGKFGRSKVALRAFCLTSHKEIVLSKSCDAHFTTDPYHTQFYLSDLTDNNIDFTPCTAHIYPIKGSVLTRSLPSTSLTITRQSTRTSLIVSLFDNNRNSTQKQKNFIDMPTDMNVIVSIVTMEQTDRIHERIREETQYLVADYSLSRLQCLDVISRNQYTTEAPLLTEVREERTKREMEEVLQGATEAPVPRQGPKSNSNTSNTVVQSFKPLKLPKKPIGPKPILNSELKACLQNKVSTPQSKQTTAKKERPQVSKKKPLTKEDSRRTPSTPRRLEHSYEDIDTYVPPSRHDCKKLPQIPSQQMLTKRVNGHGTTLRSSPQQEASSQQKEAGANRHNQAPTDPANTTPYSSYVKFSKTASLALGGNLEKSEMLMLLGEIAEIKEELAKITSRISDIEIHQAVLKAELKTRPAPHQHSSTITSTMGTADVLKALNAVGLARYVNIFSKEGIDGALFLMLDEEVLQKELHITSKAHRDKILKMKGNTK